eukprot:1174158-Amphidinium_carterae.1
MVFFVLNGIGGRKRFLCESIPSCINDVVDLTPPPGMEADNKKTTLSCITMATKLLHASNSEQKHFLYIE